MNINEIKTRQVELLKAICFENDVNFNSMEKLLQSEKVKKLQKRNHYIQQTIDSIIEKAIDNENK